MSVNAERAAIITGHAGCIGEVIVKRLKKEGYFTIGIDRETAKCADINILFDLSELGRTESARESLSIELAAQLSGYTLHVLVNNAALQVVSSVCDMGVGDYIRSIDVNLVAPFVLSKMMLDYLQMSHGSIINIGSVHADMTKPGFVAYASSKAGLKGLTQAMAVECGKTVRVNMIQPAAIETPMLASGFDDPADKEKLARYHPTETIGEASEIARAVVFMVSEGRSFINGAVLRLDGGIGVRLHDPV